MSDRFVVTVAGGKRVGRATTQLSLAVVQARDLRDCGYAVWIRNLTNTAVVELTVDGPLPAAESTAATALALSVRNILSNTQGAAPT